MADPEAPEAKAVIELAKDRFADRLRDVAVN
jgi:hypothetical protein